MFRLIKNIILIAILGVLVAVFLPEIKNAFTKIQKQYLPCNSAVKYSLGSFDERFKISKEEFLESIKKAEEAWEVPAGRELFVYDEKSSLKINLVYDSRQSATQSLKEIGKVLDKNQNSYDNLKLEYENLKRDYENKSIAMEQRVKNFEERKATYDKDVADWNKKGGAPEDVYKKLEIEKSFLNKEISEINRLQYDINLVAQKINFLVPQMNELAKGFNKDVATYNNIAGFHGEEFDGGIYHIGADGEYIDIYQFEDEEKLVRILAHELGHALGILEHSDDKEAIMYRLNNGKDLVANQSDLVMLESVCKKGQVVDGASTKIREFFEITKEAFQNVLVSLKLKEV